MVVNDEGTRFFAMAKYESAQYLALLFLFQVLLVCQEKKMMVFNIINHKLQELCHSSRGP